MCSNAIVNRACHSLNGGSLELTVYLFQLFINYIFQLFSIKLFVMRDHIFSHWSNPASSELPVQLQFLLTDGASLTLHKSIVDALYIVQGNCLLCILIAPVICCH